MRGAGGFGKTVLAQALAHSDEVYEQFHDGVLWVTLGERPSLIEKLADLLKTLTGEPQGFTQVNDAVNKLREVLAERKCLLVIDDVWSESHLRPFIDGAPLTARLVTTRRDDILPKGAVRVAVDAMKAAEAVELLSQGLGEIGPAEQAALRTGDGASQRVAGDHPAGQRLSAQGGGARRHPARGDPAGQRPARPQEADGVRPHGGKGARGGSREHHPRQRRLSGGGDRQGPGPKVYNGQRYDELAVFPEDVEVPIATIARLWAGIAEVDGIDARDLLKHLYSLALLQALDLKRGTVRLHDVMRKYLFTKQQAANALIGLHHQFVMAYDAESGEHVSDMGEEERKYFTLGFRRICLRPASAKCSTGCGLIRSGCSGSWMRLEGRGLSSRTTKNWSRIGSHCMGLSAGRCV